MPSNNDLNLRIDAIERLLKLFKMERTIYIIVTLLSLMTLLSCAIYLLISRGASEIIPVTGLFGSSGAITFTLGRLLKMWNDAMNILSPGDSSEKGGNDNE